jgi:glycine cleavage system aminomethyltransferase T/glycine/D-amino acid oxidase-like deaminating enzyme
LSDLPREARVVIVGGGIVGCSLAYHLGKRGCRDVVLLERRKLTCGTTWHAAGLVGQLRATQNLTRLAQYTANLYAGLEAETGQATGFRQRGSLAVASHAERFEELRRVAAMARCFGLAVEVMTPSEAGALYPLLQTNDLVGAVFLPKDGQTNPVDTAQALAKGARAAGVRIVEDTPVTAVLHRAGRISGVRTPQGEIAAEIVVNCAGMWGRDLAASCGVSVPLHAAEHFYIVTEPMAEVSPNLPVLRDPDSRAYFKEEAGKLLVGWFEAKAKPWGMAGIPPDFSFDTLPADIEHIEPELEHAIHRVPALAKAGIKLFFNGPESFTPDNRYFLGEAPELRNFWLACGFNSIGIQSAGGAGRVLADWILDGHPPMDLWDVDIRRTMPFQRNRRYLRDRTVETLGLLYDMHWPFRQVESARGVRRSPLHDRLGAAGACFGELAGWERANWFAPPGTKPEYRYSYGRQNWFEFSAAEHRAVREAVGLFDQTSFGKYIVEGPDAEAVLDRISANNIAVPPGRCVYTQWLNERGGIEADLTITRESETRFLVVTSAACQTRDLGWLKRNTPAEARVGIFDATSAYAVLGIMGPRSRALLQRLSDDDLSNAAFPFAASREIDLAYARVRATRITYVGELGWELYIPSEFALGVYDAIVAAGAEFGLRHAGYHALNSLRVEKAYRHWGHDITEEDTPFEAGLGFAVAFGKDRPFIGREALLRQRDAGLKRRLATFTLDDPDRMLYHNEPIWRDGALVGRTTSAMFGHTVGRAIAFGYVEDEGRIVASEFLRTGAYEIEVGGERIPARCTLGALYDAKSERIRS